MKITIKTVKGEKFDIETQPSTKISELKEKIQQKLSIDPQQQKLISSGKHLADDKSLEELNIKDNDNLILMVLKSVKPKEKQPEQNPPTQTQPQQPTPQTNPQTTPQNIQQPTQQNQTTQNQFNPTPQQQTTQPQQQQLDPQNEIVQGHQQKEELIKELMDMGFPRPQVEQCLVAAYYDKNTAVNYLLNGIPEYILNDNTQQQEEGQQGQDGQGVVQLTQEQMQQLQLLSQSPALQTLRQQFQQNPQLIPQFLTQLQTQNPQLYQLFSQNPNLLAVLLSGNMNIEEQGQQQPQQQVQGQQGQQQQAQQEIQLTDEDMNAIQQMMAFGFTQEQCVEAYLVCNKDSELALNYLLDQ